MIVTEERLRASRLIVSKKCRGCGYGKLLTLEMIKYASKNFTGKKLFGYAALTVIDLYIKLGFKVVSDIIMIENLPHKQMELDWSKVN